MSSKLANGCGAATRQHQHMSERTSTEPAAAAWWSRAQRALGFGPLLLFAVYHLWSQWPALYGREAWTERTERYGIGSALGAVVLALFALHAGLGLYRHLRVPDRRLARGRRSFQGVTGLTIVGFTLYHLTHVWPSTDGSVATLERNHEHLWELLGQPPVLVAYVLGCGALAGHAAHALATWLEPYFPHRAQLTLRLIAGLSGLVLFTLYLQLIGQYAVGEPMLPG